MGDCCGKENKPAEAEQRQVAASSTQQNQSDTANQPAVKVTVEKTDPKPQQKDTTAATEPAKADTKLEVQKTCNLLNFTFWILVFILNMLEY